MKKKVLAIILAALCVLTCAFSACKQVNPNVDNPPGGEYNDPSLDDIYG